MYSPIENPDILSLSTAQYSLTHNLDSSGVYFLHESHIQETKSFSLKRKHDFLAGRYCAIKALELSGMPGIFEIPILPDRSPDWPEGWIGSITHTEGFTSAAVAKRETLRAIGIDTERIMTCETANEVAGLILLPSELLYWDMELKPSLNYETFVTLIFSAKESIYKCLNPIVGVFIDFHDVEIFSLDMISGSFNFKILKSFSDLFNHGIFQPGKFEITLPFIHTAVELGNEAF